MAGNNYLEIDPKPNIFAYLCNYDDINDALTNASLMADTETAIPEIKESDIPFNVKIIRPFPGICVKTKTDGNREVFINLCHHNALPPPPINVEAIINDPEESLFHFPLSFGHPHIEIDKSGHECRCFDVVINSDYYHHEILKKTAIRDFIFTLVALGLEEEFNVFIDKESLRILTEPYLGKMLDHVIRIPPKTKEKILPFDDIAVPDSKPSTSLIDSDAEHAESKKIKIIDDTAVTTPEVGDYDKTNICKEKTGNPFDTTKLPIKPKPGLCAKTLTYDYEKIFINLCHHNAVPSLPPTMNVHNIIDAYYNKLTPEKSLFNFPLSLGDLRAENDKSGKECKCFDVVINSDYYHHEVLKKPYLRDFILTLASMDIEQKHDIKIDVEVFKILTKRYHGKMTDHFIRLLHLPETDKKRISNKKE